MSVIVFKTTLGFLDAVALPIYAPQSNVLLQFFMTFVANFSFTFAELSSKFLKKLPKPSVARVLSLSVIDLPFLHLTRLPINNFAPVFAVSLSIPIALE